MQNLGICLRIGQTMKYFEYNSSHQFYVKSFVLLNSNEKQLHASQTVRMIHFTQRKRTEDAEGNQRRRSVAT